MQKSVSEADFQHHIDPTDLIVSELSTVELPRMTGKMYSKPAPTLERLPQGRCGVLFSTPFIRTPID